MQYASGILLPPVQKLVATIIFCPGWGRKCISSPVIRTNDKGEAKASPLSFRKTANPSPDFAKSP